MKRLAVLCAVAVAACKGGRQQARGPEAVPVTVAAVEKKDVPMLVRAIGAVEPIESVQVRSQVAGQIQKVHFREGAEVKKGDPLFTIDPRPYRAALLQAQATLARDRARAHDAEATAKRLEGLVKKEYVSSQQAETARADANAALATVQADEAAVENTRLSLSYCEIRSPITGRTGSVLIKAGNVVKVNDSILVLIDQLRPIYVSFSVPERALPQIRARAREKLGVEAQASDQKPGEVPEARTLRGESQQGELTFIDNAVNTVTGTILLKGTFPNSDDSLWPGQYVLVTLKLGEQHDAVVAPAVAIQRGQQGQYAFVVKQDGTVESRAVTVGSSDEKEAVIDKGLRPGEVVVTDGQLRLSPGTKVQVKGGAAGSGT
ncbi:MAG: efflux RND transporter periplasmic adaptor subunit [Myxococcales bacterium]